MEIIVKIEKTETKNMEKDEDKDCSLNTMGPTEYLINASLKLYQGS